MGEQVGRFSVSRDVVCENRYLEKTLNYLLSAIISININLSFQFDLPGTKLLRANDKLNWQQFHSHCCVTGENVRIQVKKSCKNLKLSLVNVFFEFNLLYKNLLSFFHSGTRKRNLLSIFWNHLYLVVACIFSESHAQSHGNALPFRFVTHLHLDSPSRWWVRINWWDYADNVTLFLALSQVFIIICSTTNLFHFDSRLFCSLILDTFHFYRSCGKCYWWVGTGPAYETSYFLKKEANLKHF